MKKYMCHSGWVSSPYDNQMHRIAAVELPGLYHVPHKECIFVGERKDELRGLSQERLDMFIHLGPSRNGDYKVPASAGGLRREHIYFN